MEETFVQLIEKLENLAPYLWQAAVHGMYVRSWVWMFTFGTFMIIFLMLARHFWKLVPNNEYRKNTKDYNDESFIPVAVCCVLAGVCVLCAAFQLTGILAPEYYALKTFLP